MKIGVNGYGLKNIKNKDMLENKNLDKLYMMEERLREVCWELSMKDAIGWGPYLEDLNNEKEDLILKIKEWKIKKQQNLNGTGKFI